MESITETLANTLPAWATEVLNSKTTLVVTAVSLMLFGLASCRLFAKAGYHGALGLLVFLPVVNVMAFLFLAFAQWPVERELRSLRSVERAVRKAEGRHLRRVA